MIEREGAEIDDASGASLLQALATKIWPMVTEHGPITKSEVEVILGYDQSAVLCPTGVSKQFGEWCRR